MHVSILTTIVNWNFYHVNRNVIISWVKQPFGSRLTSSAQQENNSENEVSLIYELHFMNLIGLRMIPCFSHLFYLVFYFKTYYSPELWVTKSFRESRVTFLVSPLSMSVKYHTFLSSTQHPNGGHRAQWLRGFSSNCMKSAQLQLSQWKDIFLLLQILKGIIFPWIFL